MNVKRTLFVSNYFCLLLLAGCGGQLYKVAPLPANAPPVISTNNANGLNIGAVMLDGDQSFEQFEANLPVAGLIAVEVRLLNQTSGMIDTNKLRFELLTAGGAKYKLTAPKKALKRVIDYYGNSLYRIDARRRTEEDYEKVALNLKTAISPQEERRGFLFFKTKQDASNLSGLSLVMKGNDSPLTLQLKTR